MPRPTTKAGAQKVLNLTIRQWLAAKRDEHDAGVKFQKSIRERKRADAALQGAIGNAAEKGIL